MLFLRLLFGGALPIVYLPRWNCISVARLRRSRARSPFKHMVDEVEMLSALVSYTEKREES